MTRAEQLRPEFCKIAECPVFALKGYCRISREQIEGHYKLGMRLKQIKAQYAARALSDPKRFAEDCQQSLGW